MTSVCLARLRKEYRDLQKRPVENIRAAPRETNLLEWHYVLEGPKGSAYEGGFYHGVVTFPKDYPYKPPSLQMFTPNGRFKPHTRLCLSMSDFHPETWNPLWSVGTVLLGLFSFMQEETPTFGSISASESQRRQLAADSLAYNTQSKVFCELFPDLVELHEQRKKQVSPPLALSAASPSPASPPPSWSTLLALLLSLLALTYLLLAYSV
eukprot:gene30284-36593_t